MNNIFALYHTNITNVDRCDKIIKVFASTYYPERIGQIALAVVTGCHVVDMVWIIDKEVQVQVKRIRKMVTVTIYKKIEVQRKISTELDPTTISSSFNTMIFK